MTDLRTSYLGLELRSPVVASAGPLTAHPDQVEAMARAGAGAVVLPSLFEEQIEDETTAVDQYLALVETTVARVEIPVIASLNGTHVGGWIRHARLLEDAGAAAIELNLYAVAADPALPGQMLEGEQIALVDLLAEELGIPVSVKISPFYTSVSAFSLALQSAGAAGIVMFNRFYQPDLDLETLEVMPRIALSTPEELRLPLRWIGILRDHLHISIGASTGIHGGQDAAKVILAGADVAMTTSAVLRHGPGHIATICQELRDWMSEHEHHSVAQMRGALHRRAAADPEAYERANYIGNLSAFTSSFIAPR